MAIDYRTADHTASGAAITHEGRVWHIAPLIARGDTAALATLGIYPHETAPGDAPLGYTDWTLSNGVYTREPAGTPEERAAASLAQWRESVEITRLQARRAGIQAGYWDAIMAWAAGADAETAAFFEDAIHWRRNDPILITGAAALGLDDAALDGLFQLALTL